MKLNFNIWRILGFLTIVLFFFIFFKVAIYLGISLVLFLLGYPITYQLKKIKIRGRMLPNALASLITLFIMIGVVAGLFFLIVPPLITEVKLLSSLNFYDVMQNTLAQFPGVKSLLLKFGNEEELKQNISSQLNTYINKGNITTIINHVFDYFGIVFIGMLCVLFITFFLLKDENIVKESILAMTPVQYEGETLEILRTSKKMLNRYFSALFLDMFLVGCAVLIVLSILGIKNALVISFCAALLNVVPYIGSVITMVIALILGVSECLGTGSYELILPILNKIFFGLLCINLVDGFIVQPMIFSNSVRAHPLEVFIITLMASTVAGIPGMVVALPTYTLFRIVAKEFLAHLKFFRKISGSITD